MDSRTANLGPIPVLTAICLVALPSISSAGTPLIDAVADNDAAVVRVMLDEGADVNAREADGTTALHTAARLGAVETAGLLIGAGAELDAATRYGVTPLALAAANGSPEFVARLLDAGADPNTMSREGQTVLMGAALNGTPATIQRLLQSGADVNATEQFRGQTALMWAAAKGNTNAVAALVAAGADISAESRAGFTAFLFAVRQDRIGAARKLLDLGADVEDKAPDGTSALNVAMVNAYYDLASLLLDFGADPNVPDPRGSALHTLAWLHKPGSTWDAAALSSEPETAPRPLGRLSALDIGRKLLEFGADPDFRIDFEEQRFTKGLGTTRNLPGLMLGRHYLSYRGATPLYVAARNGDYRLMELLVEFGADATIPTLSGVTPLMAAAGLDYYEGETPGPFVGVPEAERLRAVKLAHELGNDIDARTDFGDYEMVGSARFTLLTYPENFDELVHLGVGDFRFDGMSAIHGAVISNQPTILRYLIDQGADVNAMNRLGWTPYMMTQGLFLANARKDFPVAAQMLLEAGAHVGRY
ncbi:ankyrin repeat domain-containing protein [Candidatus Rariloculus sp.]|uniref:ankyrin repeat domain-containing protein n=1 Tax=Candidatus Rariloculus sp. TaxID=3101265 RepID=UPI003D0C1AC9